MTRFVILAAPRTGSNLLCTLLNSHPRILCHHELFNPQGIFTARDFGDDEVIQQVSLQERDQHPLQFLSQIWSASQDSACVGFKWTRGQNEQVLAHVVDDASIKKIVLRRRNRIKTYVSELIAQQTDQWEVYQPQTLVLPRPRVRVELASLWEHIQKNQDFYARLNDRLRRSGQECFGMEYESLLTASEHARVLRFLASEPSDAILRPASVKQNSMDLRASISNFDELSTQLADTEWAAELRDVGL